MKGRITVAEERLVLKMVCSTYVSPGTICGADLFDYMLETLH